MNADVVFRKDSEMVKKKRQTQSEGVTRESETKVTESMLCGPAEVWRKENEREREDDRQGEGARTLRRIVRKRKLLHMQAL